MRIVFYTNNPSPHQLPLARSVTARVGIENFLFVYDERGWMGQLVETDVRLAAADDETAEEWLENADAMYTCGLRPIDLMERRARRGLVTFYASERWLRPMPLKDDRWTLPGRIRLLVPWFRRMTNRFVTLARSYSCVKFLPIGPWAEADFRSLGIPAKKMIPWGYFVAPSAQDRLPIAGPKPSTTRILWVGRLLRLKRVDAIIRAVDALERRRGEPPCNIRLTVAGEGPDRPRLERMVASFGLGHLVEFLPWQKMEDVRGLMRVHDIYVFASDSQEGWGAVVNEALEEGMSVLATRESGAGAAMLPRERLFAAGDWRYLAELIARDIRGELPPCSIGTWTAEAAADFLMKECQGGER